MNESTPAPKPAPPRPTAPRPAESQAVPEDAEQAELADSLRSIRATGEDLPERPAPDATD